MLGCRFLPPFPLFPFSQSAVSRCDFATVRKSPSFLPLEKRHRAFFPFSFFPGFPVMSGKRLSFLAPKGKGCPFFPAFSLFPSLPREGGKDSYRCYVLPFLFLFLFQFSVDARARKNSSLSFPPPYTLPLFSYNPLKSLVGQ